MHVQIGVSTMRLQGDAVPLRMQVQGHDVFFIDQCGRDGREETEFAGTRFSIIHSAERGLSRSRNLAMTMARAELLWLCDDDVRIAKDAEETILAAFATHPKADGIAFNVPSDTKDRPQREIVQEHALHLRNAMRYPTYRFVYRRESLVNAGLRFDERFGSGAIYTSGEDSLFTAACLHAGLKLLAVPCEIARVKHEDSSWFEGFTDKFLHDKGALFEAIFGYGLPYCALMLLRHPDWRAGRSFWKALRVMRRGATEYRTGNCAR